MRLLLLYFLAALPGAVVGMSLGSVVGYEREFETARRMHQSRPENHPVLYSCEAAGIIIGSLPGIALVTWSRKRSNRQRTV